MSFGWSASDLATAVKLLHKVGIPLQESGGASLNFQETLNFLQTLSPTLGLINALQNVPHESEWSENLRNHCSLIRGPVESFLDGIQSKHESLEHDTKWYNI